MPSTENNDPRLTDEGRQFYDLFVQLTRAQKLEAAKKLRAADPQLADLADEIERQYRRPRHG